jgi:hypothetical protein
VLRLLVALVALGAPLAASASPDDILARPLVLDRGDAIARVAVELDLASGRFARPLAIAPEIWLGVAPRWMIGLIHANDSVDQIDARASLCFRGGDPLSCDHVYRGSGLDVRWRWREGALAIAPRARLLVRDIDPWKPAITLGALARWTRGRAAVTGDPYLRLGLANQSSGNQAALFVPIWFAVQPARGWELAVHTGYDAELAVLRDGAHGPFAWVVSTRATSQLDLRIEAGWAKLLGPQHDGRHGAVMIGAGWHS